ncbi:MAG TPA: class I SAM-dependent methyltransferase [bacterium]|nr:class I SAM-dependent methyltransferase [bacterium]HQO34883.1 class I SAM-dependent methyltransferase [bacterium]HQP99058.1 class I SAM-dependent methyltransferase [bacterium]
MPRYGYKHVGSEIRRSAGLYRRRYRARIRPIPSCRRKQIPVLQTDGQSATDPQDRQALRHYFETSHPYLRDLQTHDETYHRQFLTLVRQWIPSGACVLDIGCGTGLSTVLLSRTGYHAVGADLSPLFLQEGGQCGQVALVATDAESLPFPSGTFEAIVGFEFIEHVGDVPAVLTELIRILKPGGILLLHSPNLCSPFFPLRDFISLLFGGKGRPVFAETKEQALRWLAVNLRRTVQKIRSPFPDFLYRKPDLSGRYVGGDADSVYLACQIDLAHYLRRQHIEILQKAWGERILSRCLAGLLPNCAPYIALVARKPRDVNAVLCSSGIPPTSIQ